MWSKYPASMPPISLPERGLLGFAAVAIIVLVAYISILSDYNSAEKVFEQKASLLHDEVLQRLGTLDVLLISLVGFRHASDDLQDVHLATFANELLSAYPHVGPLLFSNKVNALERGKLEQSMQDEGYVQFRISESHDGKLVPAKQSPNYFPVTLIEPLKPRWGSLLGYDLTSDPDLLPAIDKAVLSGDAVASRPTRLLGEDEQIMIFQAFYQGRYAPKSTEERLQFVDGVVALRLSVKSLLMNLTSLLESDHLSLDIIISHDAIARNPPVQTDATPADSFFSLADFTYDGLLEMYGHRSTLKISQSFDIHIIDFNQLIINVLITFAMLMASGVAWWNYRTRQYQKLRYEDAISKDEQHFKDMLDTTFASVIILDQDSRILTWNKHAEFMFGWRRDEVQHKKLPESLIKLDIQSILDKTLRTNSNPSTSWREETIAQHSNGDEFPVEVGISFTKIEDGFRKNIFILDISERKHQEETLQIAKKEAERASEAKSEFLSSMSHELRTPMNAILGFSQLLEMDDLNDMQRENVEEILKAGHHLLDLINQVLDLAKIEAGHLALSPEPVNVCTIIEECLNLIGSMADKRDIQVIHCLYKGATVQTDRTRFKQIMLNLLSNAIKYNRDGGSVMIETHPKGRDRLRFHIKDTGAGIPPEKMNDLFKPFNRLGAENSEIQGTGIGLTLTRHIVEKMGGKMGAKSKMGTGSNFWFDLPLMASPTIEDNPGTS